MKIKEFSIPLTTAQCEDLRKENGKFCYKDTELSYITLCGVITKITTRSCFLTDFYSNLFIIKKDTLVFEGGSYKLIVKPFIKNNKIFFYCIEASSISFEGELFHYVEIKMMNKKSNS
ncbi:hypothetical protein A0H76_1754 [Hepatospora eriocheir]|uniref:Uncharacterized protein n=1 Tax=Hepatospora eriocheir TaxID=1081669 RepID=A0A1X0QKH1_9MICR|nr:hypothetical protein A0H76_1754 [Hepatospora eriocheir]